MVKRRDHRSHTVNKGSRLLRRQSNELPGPQVLTLAWGSKRIGDRTPASSSNLSDAAPDYQPYNSKLRSSKDARKHWNQVRMRVMQRWIHFISQRTRFLLNLKGNIRLTTKSRRCRAKFERRKLKKNPLKKEARRLRMIIGPLNARGLNFIGKRQNLITFCIKHELSILAIQETKIAHCGTEEPKTLVERELENTRNGKSTSPLACVTPTGRNYSKQNKHNNHVDQPQHFSRTRKND